jgi:hypothetical protein
MARSRGLGDVYKRQDYAYPSHGSFFTMLVD